MDIYNIMTNSALRKSLGVTQYKLEQMYTHMSVCNCAHNCTQPHSLISNWTDLDIILIFIGNYDMI